MQLRPYRDLDQDQLIDLWRTCNLIAPVNDPFRGIERKS